MSLLPMRGLGSAPHVCHICDISLFVCIVCDMMADVPCHGNESHMKPHEAMMAMKAMCQVSPISALCTCYCKHLGVRINTLSDICVLDITKTREISIKVWKLQ